MSKELIEEMQEILNPMRLAVRLENTIYNADEVLDLFERAIEELELCQQSEINKGK